MWIKMTKQQEVFLGTIDSYSHLLFYKEAKQSALPGGTKGVSLAFSTQGADSYLVAISWIVWLSEK